jgi:hypothetical protein
VWVDETYEEVVGSDLLVLVASKERLDDHMPFKAEGLQLQSKEKDELEHRNEC